MMQVDLLPWRQRRARRRAALLLLCLELALLSTALSAGYLEGKRRHRVLWQTLIQEQARQRQLAETHGQVRRLRLALQRERDRRSAEKAGRRHNLRYLALLESLPAIMSDSLWLTALSARGDTLRLVGRGPEYADIVGFGRALEAYPTLERADLRRAVRGAAERDLLQFTLQADWKAAEAAGGDATDE